MSILDRPSSAAAILLRRDFPILEQRVHGNPLVYLDNAATTHKPQSSSTVWDATMRRKMPTSIGAYICLSESATDAYEGARGTVRRFLNAADAREIIFVRGTTEAINLVAQTYGRRTWRPATRS